ASVFHIFGALLNGAALCMIPQEEILDATKFAEFVERIRPHIMCITPTLFNNIVDRTPEALIPFRKIYVGGEALSKEHMHRALKMIARPDVLVNAYGPTEGSCISTFYPVNTVLADNIKTVPIGKPVT
ncbi:MAG: AMP-binding protein, partial [Flammeovirgaceae bacterium]